MQKFFCFLLVLAVLILPTSCGGKPQSVSSGENASGLESGESISDAMTGEGESNTDFSGDSSESTATGSEPQENVSSTDTATTPGTNSAAQPSSKTQIASSKAASSVVSSTPAQPTPPSSSTAPPVASSTPQTPITRTVTIRDDLAHEVANQINAYRQSQSSPLPMLPWTNADYQRAKDVAWDNVNTKIGSEMATHLARQIGTWGTMPISNAVLQWKNSPTHNVNMLNTDMVTMAVCVVEITYSDIAPEFVAIANFSRAA